MNRTETPSGSQGIKPHNQGSGTIFKSAILERLTRTHIAVPVLLYIIIPAGLLWWSSDVTTLSLWTTVGLFFAGWISFTLVEYLVHRYVFHMSTETHTKEKVQYSIHGVHHEYPRDKDRLAMPPPLSILLAVVFLGLFYALMQSFAFSFLAGFIFGYSMYLLIHFAVHARRPPKNGLRILWTHHAIHHYQNHDVAYGVTSPLWDFIFRTMP